MPNCPICREELETTPAALEECAEICAAEFKKPMSDPSLAVDCWAKEHTFDAWRFFRHAQSSSKPSPWRGRAPGGTPSRNVVGTRYPIACDPTPVVIQACKVRTSPSVPIANIVNYGIGITTWASLEYELCPLESTAVVT